MRLLVRIVLHALAHVFRVNGCRTDHCLIGDHCYLGYRCVECGYFTPAFHSKACSCLDGERDDD